MKSAKIGLRDVKQAGNILILSIDNLNMTSASITTDGVYGSCENLEYLKEKGITSYAKYNGFERENKKLYYHKIRAA